MNASLPAPPLAHVTAAILAGGAGTRLGGAAKALLEVGGKTILARQLAVLQPLCAEVLLVVASDSTALSGAGVRLVSDVEPGKGAPGGVHAALSAARTPWVFALACDMPFVSAEAILMLAGHLGPGVDAVAPLRNGYLEPLFAFYAAHLQGPFGQALQGGNPSLNRLLEASRLVRVDEASLLAVDPSGRTLENVNTPSDLARARDL